MVPTFMPLYFSPIQDTETATAKIAINRLNIYPKYVANLGLDLDLQEVEKAWALLGKKLHKTQNFPAKQIGEINQLFIKHFAKQ